MENHREEHIGLATHNRVLLGHRGVNLHLVQSLAPEEHSNYHRRACAMGIALPCAVVRNKKYLISKIVKARGSSVDKSAR